MNRESSSEAALRAVEADARQMAGEPSFQPSAFKRTGEMEDVDELKSSACTRLVSSLDMASAVGNATRGRFQSKTKP